MQEYRILHMIILSNWTEVQREWEGFSFGQVNHDAVKQNPLSEFKAKNAWELMTVHNNNKIGL